MRKGKSGPFPNSNRSDAALPVSRQGDNSVHLGIRRAGLLFAVI
jgi:hypothetical protein